MSLTTRTWRSHLPVSAADALAWHGRQGAFERLTPPWADVSVLESRGTMQPGDGKRLKIGLGPLTTTWRIEHDALPDGTGFLDRQLSGPFAEWTHKHRFQDDPEGGSWLEDRVHYRLPYRSLGDALLEGRIGAELERVFAYRHEVTRHDLAVHARHAEPPLRIAVTGATGLIGRRLVPFLRAGGHTVHRIVRTSTGAPDEIIWNPERGQIDAAALEGFNAVIHLSGESIAGGRWSAERKARIRASRIEGTSLLARTLASLERKPDVFVSTSAVGFYGNRGAERLTEDAASGSGFLAEVCQAWESAAKPARDAGIRVVHPRFGVVLAGDGGMLKQISLPFKFGFGGKLGSGAQYVSWIAIDDLLGLLLETIRNDELEGPINAVSPEAITNSELTAALGSVLKRPTFATLPAFAVKAGFGEMGQELLLFSQRVEPDKIERFGFTFQYADLTSALRHELAPRFDPSRHGGASPSRS